jgi:hypothetical protein
LLQKHQARIERSANKHRRAVDFGVGDEVYLKTKDWSTDRPSQKLDFLMAGPYKVTEKVFDSFKLKLPDTIDIHLSSLLTSSAFLTMTLSLAKSMNLQLL